MTARILIVDDEPINLATMEAFLSADGYDLHFAANGREACTKARELRPDLILLDVMMPEMDGYGVCRAIRGDAHIGSVPIIMVTALHDQDSRLQGLRAGADDFITKPCSRDEVRARVRTIATLNRFRSIAEQRARFEQLYELAPGAVVLTDEHGTVLTANRLAQSTFGFTEDGGRGRRLFQVFDSEAAGHVSAAVAAAVNQRPCRVEEVRRTADGATKVFFLRSASVPDGPRQLAMLAFDDVTAEVQAREALQRLNADLEAKVRARTRQLEEANTLLLSYASFVSHDLRSPLTVMKGYLELLDEGVAEISNEAKPMVAQARKAAHRMTEMISNILQLAHEIHEVGSHVAPPLDPRPVLTRLISHIRDLAPNPRTRFVVGELPPVHVSAVLIERIFFNLLTNAAKYSAEQPEPRVEIGAQPDEHGVVLFVRDNGVGFDARDTDKLFREFTRLSTAGKTEGLGLGLSLVARLVRAHGGRIWAESSVGAGATFYIFLPHPGRAEPAPANEEELAAVP